MIKKLVLSKQSYSQLGIVLFGSVFGLLLMMLSIQLYMDIKEAIDKKKETIGSHFLVLSKPVTILNTLSNTPSVFSSEELEVIRTIPGIEKIAAFKSNAFKAKAGFALGGNMMYSDMFFEAVPEDFLEVEPGKWNWQNGRSVPMILPSEYLNLYNSGFAPVQNLPQISKNAAKVSGLKIQVSGNGGNEEFEAEIVAFTDRINSILVPESFIDYANGKYAETKKEGSSRVVLMSKDPSNEKLMKLIEDNGYETNMELLKSGKMSLVLNVILGLVLGIGSVVVLMAILGFIQYSQLLINKSTYEIRTLLQLGYKVKTVFVKYLSFYTVVMLLVFVFAGIGLMLIRSTLTDYLNEKGLELPGSVHFLVFAVSLFTIVLFLVINAIGTYRSIRKLAMPA
ncbi:MAG TPA: hypothetical protein VGF79_10480 [Bacteroidia bacterium]